MMLLYGCSFLGFFRLSINYRDVVSAETLPEKKKPSLAECGMCVKMEQDGEYENTRNFNGGIRIELEYILCLEQDIMLISTGMLDSFKIMDVRHHIRKQ